MKLVDFLEQFTPEKFDWNQANEAWDEITTKHKVECQDSGTGDWIEVAPMLTDLLNLIKAGAFEDYPRKMVLTRTFTYEGKMSFPCCFTNSPDVMIDSEVYDPPIEMKPADPDYISKKALSEMLDIRKVFWDADAITAKGLDCKIYEAWCKGASSALKEIGEAIDK